MLHRLLPLPSPEAAFTNPDSIAQAILKLFFELGNRGKAGLYSLNFLKPICDIDKSLSHLCPTSRHV